MSATINASSPVGLPGAAATIARAPAAADDVQTQLPPDRSVTAPDAGNAPRMDARTAGSQLGRQVIMDQAAAMMVYQVIDKRSGAVVRQFPEEVVLRRRAYFRTLDVMRDASAEPPRVSRKA
jgi:hypothetical protein